MKHVTIRRAMLAAAVLSATTAWVGRALAVDAPPGISVPDSPGAADLLVKAADKEQQKQWRAAVEFYDQVLQQYPQRVAATASNKDTGTFGYSGLMQIVQDRIARWPAEGLDVYRQSAGVTASAALAAADAHDPAALSAVFDRYFATEAGKQAGLLLIAARTDRGEFRAAAWVGDRLLAMHPTIDAQRAVVLYATGLADFLDGDTAAAEARLTELKTQHKDDTASIGGHDVVLADALATALSKPRPTAAVPPDAADHWPTFNGPGGRGETLPSDARPGLAPHPILLSLPPLPHISPQQKSAYDPEDQQDFVSGQLMGIMPVADQGELFFQDGRTVYAVDADSGLPLPGWARTYPGPPAGRYRLNTFGRARGEQLTTTDTPTRVLAVMGQPDRLGPSIGQMVTGDIRLTCLDRATGRVAWTRSPADLPESAGPARNGAYDGTPLVINNSTVLIVARGGKAAQFDDCYVVALSLKSGDFLWASYIGSASRSFDTELYGGPKDNAQLAYADGRVFALSNLGAVAALNPTDGRVLWLTAYPRSTVDANDPAAAFMRNRLAAGRPNTKPWAQNPIIVNGGHVFVLPTDARHLLVYNAASGQEDKRINIDDYDAMDVLLGVKGNWLVTTSDAGCFCIDWTQYNHAHADDAIVAKHDNFDDTMPGGPNTVFGRGFVTDTDIFVPTRRRLYRIGFNRSGKVLETYPVRGSWGTDDAGQGPGNILVTARNVVVAGNTRVDVYTDAALAKKKYDAEIAAAPTDPAPRVRFAEVLFASGQADAALAMLNDAAGLIGGATAMKPGPGRSTVFNAALTFAQDAGRNAIAEISASAPKLFDLAGAAADTPLEQVSYRIARSTYFHEQHNYAGEVKLSQEILDDPALRSAAISEEMTGGEAARVAIGNAIGKDRGAYADVESRARAALHEAQSAHDTAKLLAVADRYPNADAAADALTAAAAAMERATDHAGAIKLLVRLYTAAPAAAAREPLLESIARNQLAMPGGVGPAIDRLARGVRTADQPRLTTPLPLPDGSVLKDISFARAVRMLRDLQADDEKRALPDLHIPPGSKTQRRPFVSENPASIAGVGVLLRGAPGFARNDRVVTYTSGEGIAIRPPLLTAPPVRVDFPELPTGIAWRDASLVAWSTQTVMGAEDSGKVAWRVSLGAVPAIALADDSQAVTDEPAPGVEDVDNAGLQFNQMRRRRFGGGIMIRNGRNFRVFQANNPPEVPTGPERFVSVRPLAGITLACTSTGRFMGINDAGEVVWQTRPADRAPDQLLTNARFIVCRLADPSGAQLVVIDTATGRVIGRRKFGPDGTPAQLVSAALSEDATLVYTLFSRLMIKDLDAPWKEPPVELTGAVNSDAAPFVGLDQATQLQVHGGRVLAAYDGGKFVRVRDLIAVDAAEVPLSTGSASNSLDLRLVGARLFAVNAKSFRQYNLSDKTDHYAPEPYTVDWVPHLRELLLGRDSAVLIDVPTDHGDNPLPLIRLLMYRRLPANTHTTRESGKLDFDPIVKDPSGILNWQAVDGGFVYLAGNHSLHALAGAR